MERRKISKGYSLSLQSVVVFPPEVTGLKKIENMYQRLRGDRNYYYQRKKLKSREIRSHNEVGPGLNFEHRHL